jgi:cob(I)alamin adenosyltransferase
MPRLTKISTTTGDSGMTSLGSQQRVPKDALRVRAYGTVDELSSHIGLALAHGLSDRLTAELTAVQSQLFNLGADLSYVEEDKGKYSLPGIEERHVVHLTDLVDELSATLGPLENFILPGGTIGASHLHVARTVCRRAEREVVTLSREERVGPHVISYLNRLSDALFQMARYENHANGSRESYWDVSA